MFSFLHHAQRYASCAGEKGLLFLTDFFSGRKNPNRYKPQRMRGHQTLWLVPMALLLGFGSVGAVFLYKEAQTSKLQSQYLTEVASKIHYDVYPGINKEMRVPTQGPYNLRLGYAYIPFFAKSLSAQHFVIEAQARASDQYQKLFTYGLYPVYPAKAVTGLTLRDESANLFYDASYPAHVYPTFKSIPPLLRNTLLFVENRELLEPAPRTRNPVIEWDRFLFAGLMYMGESFLPGIKVGGGSTLATQLEKFRFSPEGRTNGVKDKLRQIASASLRAYLNGSDTREERRRIILDYVNSTPLSARSDYGEVNSIGDGLWAWFGMDLAQASAALNLAETSRRSLRVKAFVYRSALGLILAQRRPTRYLISERAALEMLIDATLDRLRDADIISHNLWVSTKQARLKFIPKAPPVAPKLSERKKETYPLRTHLLKMLGIKDLYELDRLDLAVTTSLHYDANHAARELLKEASHEALARQHGFYGHGLLQDKNDPAKVRWSFILYERKKDGNHLRVQADNLDQALDMNEGVKLDLGSTAKLRTLVTYLELISEIYEAHVTLPRSKVYASWQTATDPLTRWATSWLLTHPHRSKTLILEAAMQRSYSADPNESFFTGGGAHHFVNFSHKEDGKNFTLYEALQKSVNLVFIRLMQDVVAATHVQSIYPHQDILTNPNHPARQKYLKRYALREGAVFLKRYSHIYKNLSQDEILHKAVQRARRGATSLTLIFKTLKPRGDFKTYKTFMDRYTLPDFDRSRLRDLFQTTSSKWPKLSDRAYVTGMHPLDFWVMAYLNENPTSSFKDLLRVSEDARVESYSWLFNSKMNGAQNSRIRILLEKDAFAKIHERWANVGYSFDSLVPSLATAIGSSADTPDSLAQLVGIILNEGVRKPTVRFEKLHFAHKTPFETIMAPSPVGGVRVLPVEVAATVRHAMLGVVDDGTASRLKNVYKNADQSSMLIGAKTGTGDHRFEEFDSKGNVTSSRAVNRTGTIVFYIGDRFFGTVTAHVAGKDAENFSFTSALASSMLAVMEPILRPLLQKTP